MTSNFVPIVACKESTLDHIPLSISETIRRHVNQGQAGANEKGTSGPFIN